MIGHSDIAIALCQYVQVHARHYALLCLAMIVSRTSRLRSSLAG